RAVAMKHIFRNTGSGSRPVLASHPTTFDYFRQLATKHDLVRTAVLDVLSTSDNDTRATVNIRPSERSNLTFAPRRNVGESREVLQVFRQCGNHCPKLRRFKETLTDIIFRQPTDVWCRDDFTTLDTELKGLSEQLCLAIDGSRRSLVFLQAAINVGV